MAGPRRSQDRPGSPRRSESESPGAPASKVETAALDGVDGLLDEIDAVLEVNAEEFVRGYVQKGGE